MIKKTKSWFFSLFSPISKKFKNPFLRLIVTKRKNIIDPDLFSKFVLICCTDLGYSPFTMQPNIRHSGNNIHRYGAFMFKS